IQTTLEIADTFGIVGTIRLDGEDYVVWGLNPKTLAAYELAYRKPIRGFARIAGKNLVAMEDGIFEVGGGTDDGLRIPAYLRTGFVDFDDPERHLAGEKLKQLLNAYLVLSAEGETMLKVRTTRRGEIIETWFRLREKPAVV